MRQHDERDLRTALREEADRHRPDREAMLTRIAQGRSAPARRPLDRFLVLLRPVAAAVAVAVVLVLAVAGVRWGNRGPEVDDTPAAAPTAGPAPSVPATTAQPKPSTATSTTTVPTRPSRSTTGTPSPPPSSPAGTPPDPARDGFLASTGLVDPHSNDGWSQGNVVLETTRTITALDVTVEVALTAGVVETGRWSNVPTNMLAMTSSRTAKMLVYRFTLQQGFTLAPGEYTFAVQFNHAAGKRDAADDSYAAAAGAGGKDAKVSGGFTPQR
ncbi:hypothetical protein [Actinoplanes sp. NPDC049599]|uniref:hypothetical protein n=1 Tax=Actinoplanes sp. NPDC049599 TaxID=3363903 RepID=UPI0037B5F61D